MKEKEIISSLDCPDLHLEKRMCGNTTKQVNFIIQKLFEGYEVDIRDHYDNYHMHNLLLKRVKIRLEAEKLLRYKQALIHVDKRVYKIDFT